MFPLLESRNHVSSGPRDQIAAPLEINSIPNQRTCHAVPTASAPSKFSAYDGDDFDACFTQQRVGIDIAVIGEDNARRCADEVGSTVPLRALSHVRSTACLDHAQLL